MKKSIAIMLLFIMLLTAACNENEDKNYYTYFIAEILNSQSDTVTKEQLNTVSTLHIAGNCSSTKNIENVPFGKDGYFWKGTQKSWDEQYGKQIEEIKVFKNLTELSILYNSELDSVDFLANMPELRSLSICMSSFTDLSPIKACKKLEELEIIGNENLSDISALAELTELKKLKISGCSVKDLSVVGELSKLEELIITYNNTDISGVDSIKTLSNLKTLSLIYPNIDISFLKDSKVRPEFLTIGGGTLDLTVIGKMKNINILLIDEAIITDLSPLDNCDAGNISIYNCDFSQNAKETSKKVNISSGLSHYAYFWLLK